MSEQDNGTKQAKRNPVDYRYDLLNHEFIHEMARLAGYGSDKYDQEPGVPNYTYNRLEGNKSSVNHMYDHLRQYITGRRHDHYGDLEHQLVAIAYNAMMEFYYLTQTEGGSTVRSTFRVDEKPMPPAEPAEPTDYVPGWKNQEGLSRYDFSDYWEEGHMTSTAPADPVVASPATEPAAQSGPTAWEKLTALLRG